MGRGRKLSKLISKDGNVRRKEGGGGGGRGEEGKRRRSARNRAYSKISLYIYPAWLPPLLLPYVEVELRSVGVEVCGSQGMW